MKKIFSILLAAAATISITTSCSDVPLPYDINQGNNSFGKTLPYKNASLSTFDTHSLKAYEAWSKGSSYTQATGYQDWNGSGAKSNVEVESYLISPAINTTCESGKVRLSFDQTIRYTNNVKGWENNHKVFISKDYDGIPQNFEEATWEQIDYTPVASPYSDWTLYSSGYIQIPDEYVNIDPIYIAFYFYAPASASTTWELENFLIEEGDADQVEPQPTPTIDGGTTLETALSVTDARTLISGGVGLDSKYYVKGTITGTPEISTQYGNATYDITDGISTLKVYRGYSLGAAKFKSESEIKSGDEVVVYGTLVDYNGTYEFTTGSQIVSLNGTVNDPNGGSSEPGEAQGTGTLSDPFNIAGVIAEASKLGTGETGTTDVYFKGIVSQIKEISAQYGNATFYVSDDGTTNNQFYVYRALGLGNKSVTDENFLKVGDEVIVCGKLANYNGTLETSQKNAYVYSVNGNTEGGGSDTPSGTSEGVDINGTTVTLTNSGTTAGTETVSVDFSTFGYANATEVTSVSVGDGTTITFESGTNSNAPKYYDGTKGIRVYANNIITFKGKSKIANVVMECDTYQGTDYVGNATATLSSSGNNFIYTNYVESGSGVQLRVKTLTITYAK